ncbi:hypothetical protein [Caballeronia calidae]|uniref:hypothetical protein n=1 Tax=Caballeronia calidae TaxID=1777139 RepID=UPI0012FE2FB1|nr:hypothetical protein [Caballeronia calidae]
MLIVEGASQAAHWYAHPCGGLSLGFLTGHPSSSVKHRKHRRVDAHVLGKHCMEIRAIPARRLSERVEQGSRNRNAVAQINDQSSPSSNDYQALTRKGLRHQF